MATHTYMWDLETFSEKIMAAICSGKEIAGLKKKKMKNHYDDDYDSRKIRKSRMS